MRIAVFLVKVIVQRELDNVIVRHSDGLEIFREQCEKQKTFSAAAYSGDDFDQSVIDAVEQLSEIAISLNFHEDLRKSDFKSTCRPDSGYNIQHEALRFKSK